eukprot:879334-Prorocentrum_minimum.AAC.2
MFRDGLVDLKVQGKKSYDLLDEIKVKLRDVEDLSREAKAKTEESRQLTKALQEKAKTIQEGVTANTQVIANIPLGMREGSP